MTKRRYPVIAYRLPHAMLTAPRAVRREAPIIDAWWRAEVARMDGLQMPAAVAALREAVSKFDHMLTIHSLALLSFPAAGTAPRPPHDVSQTTTTAQKK